MKSRHHSLQNIPLNNPSNSDSQITDRSERPPLSRSKTSRVHPGSQSVFILSNENTKASQLSDSNSSQFDGVKLFQCINQQIDKLQECVLEYMNYQKQNQDMKSIHGLKNLLHATVGNFLVDSSKYDDNIENIKCHANQLYQHSPNIIDSTHIPQSSYIYSNKASQIQISQVAAFTPQCTFTQYQPEEYAYEQEVDRLQDIVDKLSQERDQREQFIEDMQYEDIRTLKEERYRFDTMRMELANYLKQFKLQLLKQQCSSGYNNNSNIIFSQSLNELQDILTTAQYDWSNGNNKLFADDTTLIKFAWKEQRENKNRSLKLYQLQYRSKSVDLQDTSNKVKNNYNNHIGSDNPIKYQVVKELSEQVIDQQAQIGRINAEKEIEFTIMNNFMRQFSENAVHKQIQDQATIQQYQATIHQINYLKYKQEAQSQPQSSPLFPIQENNDQLEQISLFQDHYNLSDHQDSHQLPLQMQEQSRNVFSSCENNSNHQNNYRYQDRLEEIGQLPLQMQMEGTRGLMFTHNDTTCDYYPNNNIEPSFNQDISCINRLEDDPTHQAINFLDTLEQKPTSRFMQQSSLKKQCNLQRPEELYRLSMEFQLAERQKNKIYNNENNNTNRNHMSFNEDYVSTSTTTTNNHNNYQQKDDEENNKLREEEEQELDGERSKLESFMNENFDDVNNSLNLDDIYQMENIYNNHSNNNNNNNYNQFKPSNNNINSNNNNKQIKLDSLPKLDLSSINCSEYLLSCKNGGIPYSSKNGGAFNSFKNGTLQSSIKDGGIQNFRKNGAISNSAKNNQQLNNDICITDKAQFVEKYERLLNEKNILLERESKLSQTNIQLHKQVTQLSQHNTFILSELERERKEFEREKEHMKTKKEKLKQMKEQLSSRRKQEEDKEKQVGQQQLMNMLQEKNIIVSKQSIDQQWSVIETKKAEVERIERIVNEEWDSVKKENEKVQQLMNKMKAMKDTVYGNIQKEKEQIDQIKKQMKSKEKELNIVQEQLEKKMQQLKQQTLQDQDHHEQDLKQLHKQQQELEYQQEILVKKQEKLEQEQQQTHKDKISLLAQLQTLNQSKIQFDKDTLKLQKDKQAVDKDKQAIAQDKLALDKLRQIAEKDKQALEKDKVKLNVDRSQLDKDLQNYYKQKDALSRQELRIQEQQEDYNIKNNELSNKHYQILQEKQKFNEIQDRIKADRTKMKGLLPNLKNLASKMNDTLPDNLETSSSSSSAVTTPSQQYNQHIQYTSSTQPSYQMNSNMLRRYPSANSKRN